MMAPACAQYPHTPRSEPRQALREQGVNAGNVQSRCGSICRRLVRFEPDTFEIDEDLGEAGFILAVHATDAERVIDAKILTACCAHDDGGPQYSKREVARWRGCWTRTHYRGLT
jgi:hypothetical protein